MNKYCELIIPDNYLKAAGVFCTDDKNTSCDIELTLLENDYSH